MVGQTVIFLPHTDRKVLFRWQLSMRQEVPFVIETGSYEISAVYPLCAKQEFLMNSELCGNQDAMVPISYLCYQLLTHGSC